MKLIGKQKERARVSNKSGRLVLGNRWSLTHWAVGCESSRFVVGSENGKQFKVGEEFLKRPGIYERFLDWGWRWDRCWKPQSNGIFPKIPQSRDYVNAHEDYFFFSILSILRQNRKCLRVTYVRRMVCLSGTTFFEFPNGFRRICLFNVRLGAATHRNYLSSSSIIFFFSGRHSWQAGAGGEVSLCGRGVARWEHRARMSPPARLVHSLRGLREQRIVRHWCSAAAPYHADERTGPCLLVTLTLATPHRSACPSPPV